MGVFAFFELAITAEQYQDREKFVLENQNLQYSGLKIEFKQREHDLQMKSKPLTASMLKSYDVVLVATDHSYYDYQWIVDHAQLVIDTRNAMANVKRGKRKIVKA